MNDPIAAQPDDVEALIEQIRAFLADASKGNPHEGYRYGELLSFAAAALRRERERADAERYRHIRDYPMSPELHRIITLQQNTLWDAAIDAVRKEQQ